MSRKMSSSSGVFVLLVVGLFLLWATPMPAQTTPEPGSSDPGVTEPASPTPDGEDPVPAEPEEETPDMGNPPAYIADLLERTKLTQDQVDQMRTDGAGWGNIRIAASLAEQMAANSADSDTPLGFDEALASVLAARADGMGFGEIANENDLKIGQLMRNRNQVREPALGDGLEAEEGVQAGDTVRTRGRKRGVFARFAGFLGFGRAKRPDKAERPVRSYGSARGEKPEKPEKPSKPEKMERPERPERPEKPAKPEKPERPERGPRR